MQYTMKWFDNINQEEEVLFWHPELWDQCRVDGHTQDSMVSRLLGNSNFVVSYYGNIPIAITAYSPMESVIRTACEAHTFVLPEYRKDAQHILMGHVEYIKKGGYKYIKTLCSSRNKKVMNFLIKRLGFREVLEFETPLTVDVHS